MAIALAQTFTHIRSRAIFSLVRIKFQASRNKTLEPVFFGVTWMEVKSNGMQLSMSIFNKKAYQRFLPFLEIALLSLTPEVLFYLPRCMRRENVFSPGSKKTLPRAGSGNYLHAT